MSQKDIPTDFLALAASGRAKEAFARYAGDGFRHRNGYFHGSELTDCTEIRI